MNKLLKLPSYARLRFGYARWVVLVLLLLLFEDLCVLMIELE